MKKSRGMSFLENIAKDQKRRVKKRKRTCRDVYVTPRERWEAYCRLSPEEQDEINDFLSEGRRESRECSYCGDEYDVFFKRAKKFDMCPRCVSFRSHNRKAFKNFKSFGEYAIVREEVDVEYSLCHKWSDEKLDRQIDVRESLGLIMGMKYLQKEKDKRGDRIQHFEFDF